MSHNDYLTFEEFNRRSATPQNHTTPAAVGIAVVAGIYTLFKFLDFLGYPVWFWIRHIAHKMSMELVRALSPAPSLDSEASDDTVQSGGMMGNLFGLGTSVLQKGVRGVASALSRGPSHVPPGLGNFDNSCYQNSVIQGLASLPSLRDYLIKTTIDHESFNTETTNGALLDMISKLNDPAKRGEHFWIRGKLKSMSTFTQQDAQEYYSRILDELDKEVKKASSSKRRTSVSWIEATKSLGGLPATGHDKKDAKHEEVQTTTTPAEQAKLVPNPLDGLLAQRVGCTTCGYSEGLSLIPFNCITVSLGRNRSGYDIRECLDEYTDLEYIDGVECAKCTLLKLKSTLTPLAEAKPDSPFATRLEAVQEALDEEDLEDKTLIKKFNIPKKNWVKSEKSKQAVIARAPRSLVLHINRSIFDETTFAQYKNNAGVSYPSVLDLGNWCLGTQPSGSQQPDMDLEEWPRDPKKSMLAGGEATTTVSPFQYKLRAAVTHFGTHGNGHYVCYRPHPRPVRQASAEAEGQDLDKDQNEDEVKDVEENKEDEDENEEPTLSEEQWWRFSDDTVYAVAEQEAHQGNVFMLFYERIDELTPSEEQENVAAEQPAVTEDAPLPPVGINGTVVDVQDAVVVPLPEEDDLLDIVPPSTPTAQSTPPTLTSEATTADETETSEVDSEDDHSTQITTDSEAERATPPTHTIPKLSPHTMRTAGNPTARGQGNRASLPLVSAT